MATSANEYRDSAMGRLGCLLLTLAATPALAQAPRAAAATPNGMATMAAMQVLRAGGSAADAAVAAQMVLGVVTPNATGIGGGGMALSYDANSRTVTSWDGREAAPAASAASPAASTGGGSVGVPGLLPLLQSLHRERGRLPWADLMTPAIIAAEQGVPPATALAEVLRSVAASGAAGLTHGAIAAEIATAVRSDSAPGLLTTDDLAAYAARRDAAACLPYRDRVICSAGPPSTGGAALLEALGLLNRFDLGSLDPDGPDAVMLMIEAEQLAQADAARSVGDFSAAAMPPAAVDAGLLADRAALMNAARAINPVLAGPPPQAEQGTASLAVWDADGNAVCLTSSLGGAAGSRLVVHGVALNAAMADFSPAAGADGQPAINRIEPGKRPATAMAPTMLLAADGALIAVIGSTGGSRLPGIVLQAVTDLVDRGSDPAAALARPHRLAEPGHVLLETTPGAADLAGIIESRGERVVVDAVPSGTVLIAATPAGLDAATDPRDSGVAATQ